MSFWQNKKIIVTGGAGFVGLHLIQKLEQLGVKSILCIDDFSRGSLKKYEVIEDKLWDKGVDISYVPTDLSTSFNFMADLPQFDVLFHLAARVGSFSYYKENDGEILQQNVAIDNNVIRAAMEHKIPYVFYASSTHVYPVSFDTIDETMPINPGKIQLSYGLAKWFGEKLLTSNQSKFKGISIGRLNGFYGPNGDDDLESGSIIPVLRKRVREYPNLPVSIKTNGNERRCFCFVDDGIDAMCKMVENSEDKCLTYNVGNSTEHTIKEIAQTIIDISEKDIQLETTNKYAELHRQHINCSLIEKELGWKATTSLKDGLTKTIKSL